MLRAVAIARIQRGLGFRTDLDTEITAALQEAQRLLEQGTSLPYFLLNEDAAISLTAGTSTFSLPARFLREADNSQPHFYPTTGGITKLVKKDLDEARAIFVDADAGAPAVYALRRETIEFFPTPDVDYELEWDYYAGALPLTSNIENAWLEEEYGAPEVLIAAAGISIATDLENAPAVALFTKMLSQAWGGMFADGILRAQANRPLRVGGKL